MTVVRKASQSSRRGRREKFKSFFAATCAWQKILLGPASAKGAQSAASLFGSKIARFCASYLLYTSGFSTPMQG